MSISEFISFAHTSVNEVSLKYQQNEKRFNYTTPKSLLEFMKLYGNLLGTKRRELSQKMERLGNGLQKLLTTASQVNLTQSSINIHYQTVTMETVEAIQMWSTLSVKWFLCSFGINKAVCAAWMHPIMQTEELQKMHFKTFRSNFNYYTIFSFLEFTDTFNFIIQVFTSK